MFSTPIGAARLFLATVITLVVLKVVVGLVTGSISIWAQLADSSLDVFAAVMTFFTVSFSAKPADKEHPYGHGKVEDITAAIQGILLFAAAGSIIYASVRRIIFGEAIQLTEAGIAVMAVSMMASIFLSRHLFRVARATGSMALEANANNITGDIYSTAGVMVGLIAVRITGFTVIDPILAILVAFLIIRMGIRVGRMAFGGLIDVRLPKSEEDELIAYIKKHANELVDFHDVRTRKSGNWRFIDLHLVMPKNASVEEAHRICDHLERGIQNKLHNSNVTIHVEPCRVECDQCLVVTCTMRISPAKG